ncbi:MAG TPA: glycoside hydrolase family 16 protein [Streptosporangiaceae bacterium]|nr:glycoside hydrolase family 16 protein [Streptosporangiaceae bacterium]
MTRYTFQDEFDGSAGSPPDPARWSYDLGAGGWGNNELQTYTDSTANAFQDGQSHLVIRATRQQGPGTGNGRPDVSYHSARITTRDKFAQQGGCFEARIKVTSQRGVWPACWLMGQDIGTVGWPRCGEVDVLEDFGYSTVESSVHVPAGGLSVHTAHHDLPSDTGWHTYRLDWSADGMAFSRDGQRYLSVRPGFCEPRAWVYGPAEPHNGGMFLLLNLAVGGTVGDPPDSTRFPADLLVDYVRVTRP